MATIIHLPSIFVCLLILSTSISNSFSQPSNTSQPQLQNIQTFYPSSSTSPSPLLPQPRPRSASSVWKPIVIAAAGTVALSAIITILVKTRRSKHKKDRTSGIITSGTKMQTYEKDSNFVRFEGTIKGIIVDENGLDVLYWRQLQEENRTSFKKQYYHNMARDECVEEKRTTHEKKYHEYDEPPVQEVHLLKGQSSTSQSNCWGEIEEVQDPATTMKAAGYDHVVENGQLSSSAVQQLPGSTTRSSAVGGKETKIDVDIMEALFGYVALNRKSPSSSQKFLLDPQKSENMSTVLKSIGISRKDIIDAVLHGRQGLNAETIEKLTRIAPTSEELAQILDFDDDPARLADAESFLYDLLTSVPTAFTRLNVMLFRSNYDVEVPRLKESLMLIQSACSELTSHGKMLLRLLEAMVKAGNRLNADNGQELDLTALRKLCDVKSFDEKTGLVQFVVMEAIRAEGMKCHKAKSKKNSSTLKDVEREYLRLGLPSISTDYPNVKKAATLNYDSIVKTSSALLEQVVEMRKVVEQCGDEGRFMREMRGFLRTAESETREVKEEEARVMGEVLRKTLDYFKAGCFRNKPLQLFVMVRDFLGMVDAARLEVLNIVSSPAAAGGFQTMFRFPKLPSDFMSDMNNQ